MPRLSFYSKSTGNGPSLKLMYSTNYETGSPSTGTWTELDGLFPQVNSNVWKHSLVAIEKADNVHIAFVYTSTATAASTWSIDDWRVIDEIPATIEEGTNQLFTVLHQQYSITRFNSMSFFSGIPMKYILLTIVLFLFAARSLAQDLVLNNVSFPASLKRYQRLDATASIFSTTAVNKMVSATVYLSTDNIIDATDKSVAFFLFNSIAESETKTLNLIGGFNQFGVNAVPGNYFLITQVDANQQLAETDETNNTSVVPITILPASVDLTFKNIVPPSLPVGPGGIISVIYDIKNLASDNVSSVITEFYLSKTGPDGTRLAEWNHTYNSLNWASSTNLFQNLSVPANMLPGTYTIYGNIKNIGQELNIEETNITNNRSSFGTIIIEAKPMDLVLNSFTITSAKKDNVQYSITLTNNGGTAIEGYNIKLTFSADAILDASDKLIVKQRASSNVYMLAGETITESDHASFYPGEYLPSGTWYVFAEINYDRLLTETNYANNVKLAPGNNAIPPYTMTFANPPFVDRVTPHTFRLSIEFEENMRWAYYAIVPAGLLPQSGGYSDAPVFTGESVTLEGLEADKGYDVYVIGEFNSGVATEPYRIPVTTKTEALSPVVLPSTYAIDFQAVAKASESIVHVYEITAANLVTPVMVDVLGEFQISKNNIDYTSRIEFSPEEFSGNATKMMYVKFVPGNETGPVEGKISHTTLDGRNVEIGLSIHVFDPADHSFNNASLLEEIGWNTHNSTGSQTWKLSTENGPAGRIKSGNQVVRINGGDGGIEANEDWLITPALDLSDYTLTPELSFYSKSSGEGNALALKYSLDYVEGDPSSATWINLDGQFPVVNSNSWKLSSHIVLPKDENVRIAFVYTSTATAASTWMIDDWNVSASLLNIPDFLIEFGDVVAGNVSSAESFTLHVVGYGDVTITASPGFEVSADGSSFSSEINLTAIDVATEITVFVRFAPAAAANLIEGTIAISGAGFTTTRIVSGSSPAPLSVDKDFQRGFAVYPNPTSGPVTITWKESANIKSHSSLDVTVIGSSGVVVDTFRSSADALGVLLSSSLNRLPAGVYQIKTISRETQYLTRVVKQ